MLLNLSNALLNFFSLFMTFIPFLGILKEGGDHPRSIQLISYYLKSCLMSFANHSRFCNAPIIVVIAVQAFNNNLKSDSFLCVSRLGLKISPP